jgi:hypothetical protein
MQPNEPLQTPQQPQAQPTPVQSPAPIPQPQSTAPQETLPPSQPQVFARPQPQQSAPAPMQQQISPSGKSSPTKFIIIGVVVAVLLIGGVSAVLLTKKKSPTTNADSTTGSSITNSNGSSSTVKSSSPGVSLTDYSSQIGKFKMQIPKGAKTSDQPDSGGDGLVQVYIDGPDDASSSSLQRSLTVSTYKNSGSTKDTYDHFLTYVKNDASTDVKNPDTTSSYKTTLDKEQETTINGHKAYIAHLTQAHLKNSMEKVAIVYAYIYVDAQTNYKLDFKITPTDQSYGNNIDAMINSFNTL